MLHGKDPPSLPPGLSSFLPQASQSLVLCPWETETHQRSPLPLRSSPSAETQTGSPIMRMSYLGVMLGDCSEYRERVMGFSLGTWDTCKVSRCVGGRRSAVRINPEAHNGLVFLKDVASFRIRIGTQSYRKNVFPQGFILMR